MCLRQHVHLLHHEKRRDDAVAEQGRDKAHSEVPGRRIFFSFSCRLRISPFGGELVLTCDASRYLPWL